MKLRKPVKLSESVHPICLPDSPEVNPNSLQGDSATLVGYGPATDDSTKVNELDHRILTQQRCRAIYRVNITFLDTLDSSLAVFFVHLNIPYLQ